MHTKQHSFQIKINKRADISSGCPELLSVSILRNPGKENCTEEWLSYGHSPSLQVHARIVRLQMTAQLLLMHLGKNLILRGALKVTMTLQLLSCQERQACIHRI